MKPWIVVSIFILFFAVSVDNPAAEQEPSTQEVTLIKVYNVGVVDCYLPGYTAINGGIDINNKRHKNEVAKGETLTWYFAAEEGTEVSFEFVDKAISNCSGDSPFENKPKKIPHTVKHQKNKLSSLTSPIVDSNAEGCYTYKITCVWDTTTKEIDPIIEVPH